MVLFHSHLKLPADRKRHFLTAGFWGVAQAAKAEDLGARSLLANLGDVFWWKVNGGFPYRPNFLGALLDSLSRNLYEHYTNYADVYTCMYVSYIYICIYIYIYILYIHIHVHRDSQMLLTNTMVLSLKSPPCLLKESFGLHLCFQQSTCQKSHGKVLAFWSVNSVNLVKSHEITIFLGSIPLNPWHSQGRSAPRMSKIAAATSCRRRMIQWRERSASDLWHIIYWEMLWLWYNL